MAREKRSGFKQHYYYRSIRDGDTVRRQYIGRLGDPVVRLIADGDELSRAEGDAAVKEGRAEQAIYRNLEPMLDDITDLIDDVQTINLLICGVRRRKGELQPVKFRNIQPKRSDCERNEEPVTRELFDHLAHQANYGNPHAAQRLREILRDHPEIWGELGDLTQHAQETLIGMAAAGDFALAESLRLRVAQYRESLLAEATDQVLEGLLIDYLVVCWLEAEIARMAAVQPQQFKQDAEFWQRRQEQASGRFLKAVEELGTLRQLLAAGQAVQTGTQKATTSEEKNPI